MLYDAKSIRIGAYVRCSHDEQKLHGYTIDAQKEALQTWSDANGHKIVEWYIDEGVSARKKIKNRPEMQRMINDAESGKFDLIAITKLDRYFRSVSEYHVTQSRLENARVNWKTIHEDYTTETSDGRLKINMMLSIAENEADRTADRINKINEYKISRGQPLSGNQPIGYKIGEINGEKRVIIDEDKKQIPLDMYSHFETYNSVKAAQHYVNSKHGLIMNYYGAKKMLTEEKYSGAYKFNTQYCEPIIERERWERIQGMMKRNVKRRETNRIYLLSGLVRCTSCGRKMSGRYIKNSHGREYYYYMCNHAKANKACTHVNNLREDELERRLLENLETELMEYIFSASIVPSADAADNAEKEIAAIKRRLEKIKKMYMADIIEFDEYEREHKQLKKQLDEIKPPEKYDLTAAQSFLENINVLELYPTFSREDKQAMWRSIIRRIDCNDENDTSIIFL